MRVSVSVEAYCLSPTLSKKGMIMERRKDAEMKGKKKKKKMMMSNWRTEQAAWMRVHWRASKFQHARQDTDPNFFLNAHTYA